jgi:hypothetical protein
MKESFRVIKFDMVRVRAELVDGIHAGPTTYTFEVVQDGKGTGVFVELQAENETAFRALEHYPLTIHLKQ